MSKVTKSSSCVFNDLNVSHQNPCDELETVAYYRVNRTHLTHIPHKGYDELVTRQNAEEVIAAKDARIAELEAKLAAAKKAVETEVDHYITYFRSLQKLPKGYVLRGMAELKRRVSAVQWEAGILDMIYTPLAEEVTADRIKVLEADNKRLREALDMSEAAISEYYRYRYGGELRGSYDGKPEREGLWKAMYKARAALGEVKP